MPSKTDLNQANIQSVSWENKRLRIYFYGGKVIEYQDVPEGIYQEIITATSAGSYLRLYIARQFSCKLIKNYDEKTRLEELKYFKTTLVGCWATDRPNLLTEEQKEKYFWEVTE